MSIIYTYKLRLYPTKSQKELLEKHFGCSRFVYNYFLNRRKEIYLKEKIGSTYNKDCKELTKLKQELDWLYEVNGQSLQASLKNLDGAYNNFFAKRAKFPKFKSKKSKQSFRCPQSNKIIGNNRLQITKFKEGIKFRYKGKIEGKICYCTITKNKSNHYYCSLLVEKDVKKLAITNKEIALDVGIKNLLTDNNGIKYNQHSRIKSLKKKLAKVSRKFSKQRQKSSNKQSKRLEKTRLKLAKLYQKITNCKINNLHKITRQIINENQVIYIESLDIKSMFNNKLLTKHLQNCNFSEIIRQFEYKSEWYGRKLIKIDRFFPSSKTCSGCGWINQELKLKNRKWICPNCNIEHDRDCNAAKNILKEGQKLKKEIGLG